MNNFIFVYQGNKYLESKKIFKDFNFNEYDIIVEPFCGIFGFSRYAYEKGFRGEFYLNDISTPLINEFNDLKKNIHLYCNRISIELLKYTSDKELSYDKTKSTALSLCSTRLGSLCSIIQAQRKIKNMIKKKKDYSDFFNLVTFFNFESSIFINSLPKDKKILIFYDPPYFNSSNESYNNEFTDKDGYNDGSYFYLEILDNFNELTIDQIMIINHIDIIHHLFKKYYASCQVGKYSLSKRVKKHNLYKKIIL